MTQQPTYSDDIFTMIMIWYFIGGIFTGMMSMSLATEKGYGALIGLALGYLTGIAGLIYYAGLPDKRTRRLLKDLVQSTGRPGTD
jgi:uncharacterized membrane protein HdeD (DUF308 family)